MVKENPILAIDFDGTCCEFAYPDIGKPMPGCFETLKDLQTAGYTLILWTCRESKQLEEAIAFCRDNGIEFDSINHNRIEHGYSGSRKVFANWYIDDRSIGGFAGWDKVREILL